MAFVKQTYSKDFINKQVGDWYLIKRVGPLTTMATYKPNGKRYWIGDDVIRDNKPPYVSPHKVKESLFD